MESDTSLPLSMTRHSTFFTVTGNHITGGESHT